MICKRCGKESQGEGMSFCPYCGTRFAAAEERPIPDEVAEWIRKALKVTSLPKRKAILEEAKKACPRAPEIDWELLFVGTPDPKPPRGKIDFSIIKSWLLQIYRKPEDFSEEKRDAMRQELFDSPQLKAVLAAFPDPEGRMREYLGRLCREYIDIFLKEDNQLMGNLFGFRVRRNQEKALEAAVSDMIRKIEADEQLTQERKQLLQEALLQALKG